jgi:uncharacterized protein
VEHLDVDLTAGGVLFSLLLAFAVFWFAKRQGFFRLPPPSRSLPVTFSQTLGAFLTYFASALIIFPIILIFIAYLKTGEISSVKKLSGVWLEAVQIAFLWIVFIFLMLYCFLIPPQSRRFLFWGEGERSLARLLKGAGMGLVGLVVSYPFVLVVSLVTKYISIWLWGEGEVEQVAVKHLKQAMGNPYLFGLMVFAVIILVPCLEELLFRGFFQNLLKRYFNRSWAMVLSAIVFSLAHFSYSQKTGNFQLILSLFVLAFFLGFLYERERTLWAPMSLHMAFNGYNVLIMVFNRPLA